MPTISLVVELSEIRHRRFTELARELNTSPDLLAAAIIDNDMDQREIQDRSRSDREVAATVALSPIAQLVRLDQMRVHSKPGESTLVHYPTKATAQPRWEQLIITQDVGLPMGWNARFVNITEDTAISSSGHDGDDDFCHDTLEDALAALADHLSIQPGPPD